MSTKKENCLYPKCERSIAARGLCKQHYAAAARLVKLGRASWSGLERDGKCLKAQERAGSAWFES